MAGFHLWKTINPFFQGSKLQTLRRPAIAHSRTLALKELLLLWILSRISQKPRQINPGIDRKGELLVAKTALMDDVPWEPTSPKALLWWEQLFDTQMSLAKQAPWACFPSPGSPIAVGWLVGDTSSPATVQRLTTQTTKARFPEWAEQD